MNSFQKFWEFLKRDSFASWIVSLLLIFIAIKFILFPLLSLATGTNIPLVIVESCSMNHNSGFDDWWSQNGAWYEKMGINKTSFEDFKLKNGFTKGDVILVSSPKDVKQGDIIIFTAGTRYPVIHRVMSLSPLQTKGDNNLEQLSIEKSISSELVLGKAAARIPLIGWVKLIFFEPFKPASERGLC
jgi:signal peptidase I